MHSDSDLAPRSAAIVDDSPHWIRPGKAANLDERPTRLSTDAIGVDRATARKQTLDHLKALDELQERLYAEAKHAILVVFQAIDAGGKDSTIRRVLGRLNPQGVRVASFKVPSDLEKSHDFMWRYHMQCPPRGHIGVFNRSHYEAVLVERVREIAPEEIWSRRYEKINGFEKMLATEGATVVKFYLHLSREEQARRFRRRLTHEEKWWKFSEHDLAERRRWPAYREAFEDALTRCSTPWAPWYAVPADRKWYRDLVVAAILRQTLENLDPRHPSPEPGTAERIEEFLAELDVEKQ